MENRVQGERHIHAPISAVGGRKCGHVYVEKGRDVYRGLRGGGLETGNGRDMKKDDSAFLNVPNDFPRRLRQSEFEPLYLYPSFPMAQIDEGGRSSL